MNGRYLIVLGTSLIIIGLIITSFINFYYRSSILTGHIIAEDVKKLARIFNTIDRQCRIIGFDYDKNPINFLNVEKFSGSEIGSMNLAYPDKWDGPYLFDNLTVQSIEYMIVATDNGYFITPGDGVALPNGKVIGKDIVFDRKSDIAQMMYDKTQLYYGGRPLATQMIEYKNDAVSTDIANLEE